VYADSTSLLALIPEDDQTPTCDAANALLCNEDNIGTCCTDELLSLMGCIIPTYDGLENCVLDCSVTTSESPRASAIFAVILIAIASMRIFN